MTERLRFTLRDGADLAGADLESLWLRYVGLGGTETVQVMADLVMGLGPYERREHDVIAQALNEIFMDQGIHTFPVGYSDTLTHRLALRSTHVGGFISPAKVRRDAAAARLRSAAAARRSAALHSVAAQLMQASGQLQFAHHARARARIERQRSEPGTAA